MISFVTNKAYVRILNEDFPYSSYDAAVKIKQIILDLFEYLLANLNEHGSWDSNVVYTIAKCTRSNTTREEANCWARIVRQALCEELQIPSKGYRVYYRVVGEFIQFVPKRMPNYEDHLCGALPSLS